MSAHTFRVPSVSRAVRRRLTPLLSGLLLLAVLPLSAAAETAPSECVPKGWKARDRELNLHENPPALEREVRVTPGVLTEVDLMDGPLDLENTTLRGSGERIGLRGEDGYRLVLTVRASLAPGERLPLSVAYRDGTRLELTLVDGGLETDLEVRVRRRPRLSPEDEKAALAKALAAYALDYEWQWQSRYQYSCAPEKKEQVEEAPRVGPSEPKKVRYVCTSVSPGPRPLLSFIQRRDAVGRFTIDGKEGGGREVGLMGRGILYQTSLQTVLVVSVFNMDPQRRWRPGDVTVRKEATGEAVPVLTVRTDLSEEQEVLGALGLMSLVIDTPSSATERYVLEVPEKDGGSRRIRLEHLTFGE